MDSIKNNYNHFWQFLAKRPFLQLKSFLWVGITVVFVALLNWVQWQLNKSAFNEEASKAFDAVYEKIQVNEAILVGFASLLKTIGEDDLSQVRKFTAEVRKAYPHIYMLEAATSVKQHELSQFEQQMRVLGYDNYKVKTFDYGGNREWQDISRQAVYYPLHFIDPAGTPADDVLGMDALSVPFLKKALQASIQQDRAIASRPFELYEGGQAYVLFKPLKAHNHAVDEPLPHAGLVVSLLIKTQELLKYAATVAPGSHISLIYDGNNDHSPPAIYKGQPSTPYSLTLGAFEFEKALDDLGQPFRLHISQNGAIPAQGMLISLALLLSSFYGLFVHLKKAHYAHLREAERTANLQYLSAERNKLEQKVEQRTAALTQSNNELRVQVEKNSLLAQKLMTLQEDEFRVLARELHDEFGQVLTAINTNAHIIHKNVANHASVLESSKLILSLSDRLHSSLKGLLKRLRPQALDTFGLKTAIEECLNTFQLDSQNIDCHFDFDERANALGDDHAIAIYRIVQELVNNALKHAAPSYLNISVTMNENDVIVAVADDGPGFDLKDIQLSFGLLGVEERAKSFGGALRVEQVNALCTIEITIPIIKRTQNEHRDTDITG